MERMYALTFGFLFEQRPVDFIGKLPIIVAIMILRKLDSKSLLAASRVNKTWMSICRRDPVLRNRIRQQILTEKSLKIVSLQRKLKHFSLKNVFAPKNSPQHGIHTGLEGGNVPGTSRIHVQTIVRRSKAPAPKKAPKAKPYDQRSKPREKKSGLSFGKKMRML